MRHTLTVLLAGMTAMSSFPILAQTPAPTPTPTQAQATPPAEDDLCDVFNSMPVLGAPSSGATTPSPSPTPAASPSGTPSATPTPTPTPVASSSGSTPPKTTTPPKTPTPAAVTGSAAKCSTGISQARTDRAAVQRAIANKAVLQAAASKNGIDWRLLAAVALRETNFTNADSSDGGWGIFQLTAQPGVTHAQAWNLTFAANYAAKMLSTDMKIIKRKFPNFTADQVLQATAAAYNFGVDDISGNPATIDRGTTRNNYGINILNLMNCF